MKKIALSLLLFGFTAYANKPLCFGDTKEITIPTTKYTMTTRGEVLNAGNKFANLPLPKGFAGECIVTAPIKTDVLVILSMGAKDYDEKNAFVFRISNKETKVLWSQNLKKVVQPHLPFVNDKHVIIPAFGEVISLNPETGNIRWKFGNPDTEGVDFKKISLTGTTLQIEGSKSVDSDAGNIKFDLNLQDGKLIPPKKAAP